MSGNEKFGSRPRPLEQQVIVITGASSGIGRCSARHLAACGARVVVTARNRAALASLVGAIEAGGGEALAVPGDVRREADLQAVARGAVERFGRIDTWVNNAAVYLQGRVDQLDVEEFRQVIDVNLLGYIRGAKCALELMQRQGYGGIIQVSSIVAKRTAGWQSAYGASKAGLDAFAQALRTELWGSGIHVSTLYLPPVDTPVYRHARAKFGTIPKPPPPISDPSVVARAIARLAERPRAEYVLGEFGRWYARLSWLPPRAVDWLLHHVEGLTLTDIPAQGDNWERPLDERPDARGGWRDRGWHGLTAGDLLRALPVESAIAAGLGGAAVTIMLRRASVGRRT
jgi:NAD(P)-dependent dehydrogenase (short-subunit alcohol dehydrogenase family)